MSISESDVIAELTGDGCQVEDYFLIEDNICVVNESGALMILLIEDLPGEVEGEMHDEILDFLRRRGAAMYKSENHERTKQARSLRRLARRRRRHCEVRYVPDENLA